MSVQSTRPEPWPQVPEPWPQKPVTFVKFPNVGCYSSRTCTVGERTAVTVLGLVVTGWFAGILGYRDGEECFCGYKWADGFRVYKDKHSKPQRPYKRLRKTPCDEAGDVLFGAPFDRF